MFCYQVIMLATRYLLFGAILRTIIFHRPILHFNITHLYHMCCL